MRENIDIAPAEAVEFGPDRQESHDLPRQFRPSFAHQHFIQTLPGLPGSHLAR